MRNCKYCGNPVRFFQIAHKECKRSYLEDSKATSNIVYTYFKDKKIEHISTVIDDINKKGFISEVDKKLLIISGWEKSARHACYHKILSEEDEKILVSMAEHFNLSYNDLNKEGAYTQVGQSMILRKVMNGEMPEEINILSRLPFNWQKNEQLLWLEQEVKYFETKTKTHYTGGSRGASIRVAKGLSFRVGAFKGEKFTADETNHIDTGLLAITNKHIYFGGDRKNFRVNFNKIVSFTEYSDGFSMQRDALTAKPQTFAMKDGWFINNLISNVSNLE